MTRIAAAWHSLRAAQAPRGTLVADLIGEQFPQWTALPIEPVDVDGWNNTTIRLGHELSVRLPSAEAYAAQVDKEQRWLPVLAPQLPLRGWVPTS